MHDRRLIDPASPEQAKLTDSTPSEQSDDQLIELLTTLSKTNGNAVIQQGARIAVIGELLAALLTNLPQTVRTEVDKSFRDRIELLLSMADDSRLPERYQSALLTEVNRYPVRDQIACGSVQPPARQGRASCKTTQAKSSRLIAPPEDGHRLPAHANYSLTPMYMADSTSPGCNHVAGKRCTR
jgi:hypothetical protein